jgi:hypothetical protein
LVLLIPLKEIEINGKNDFLIKTDRMWFWDQTINGIKQNGGFSLIYNDVPAKINNFFSFSVIPFSLIPLTFVWFKGRKWINNQYLDCQVSIKHDISAINFTLLMQNVMFS